METKLGGIYVHTDSDYASIKIGDVGGGFDDKSLENHVRNHGSNQLLYTLARMITKVQIVQAKIDHPKDVKFLEKLHAVTCENNE